MTSDPRPSLLTVQQVADELVMHPKSVARYIRQRRLRAVAMGRGYRVRREDLDAFLEARLTETQPLPVVDQAAAAS